MATLPMVLINHADIKSAGGVALRVRTQGPVAQEPWYRRLDVGVQALPLASRVGSLRFSYGFAISQSEPSPSTQLLHSNGVFFVSISVTTPF